jgi:phasin family protein
VREIRWLKKAKTILDPTSQADRHLGLISQKCLNNSKYRAWISPPRERERKNIEALTQANRIAFEGWQNLVLRQSEILQDSMKRAVDDAKSQTALKNGAELARNAFETALANMRELAEMATKSQKDAFEVIRKRVEENMNELRGKKPDEGQK